MLPPFRRAERGSKIEVLWRYEMQRQWR
eukprot:COSAG02_NODE_43269_length_376_cov_0.953069_1_plen_27_part_10